MATQKVTVELPQAIFQQLARIALATQQPLEVLAAQSIASNLPPTPDSAKRRNSGRTFADANVGH
jgi:predicted transcriptional regulator